MTLMLRMHNVVTLNSSFQWPSKVWSLLMTPYINKFNGLYHDTVLKIVNLKWICDLPSWKWTLMYQDDANSTVRLWKFAFYYVENMVTCLDFEMVALLAQVKWSNRVQQDSSKLKLAYKGTKEYERAKELQCLRCEFHDHLECIYRRLESEERKLLTGREWD